MEITWFHQNLLRKGYVNLCILTFEKHRKFQVIVSEKYLHMYITDLYFNSNLSYVKEYNLPVKMQKSIKDSLIQNGEAMKYP